MSSTRMLEGVMAGVLALGCASSTQAQGEPSARPTVEQLAADNELFISLARKELHWEEPAAPCRIVGPLYFVGTKGLGAFLFATSEGLVLMNTGMPSSGPMIADSIRQLGFRVEDLRLLINGHAHIDHAGALDYLKKLSGAEMAVMREDVAAMESGDRNDFKYGDDFAYPPVAVDRILRDGDTIRMGEVLLTAYLTPGHTRGSTTWVACLVAAGRSYVVAFPDGAGFNPGYRLVEDPSYPGIADDYRHTHHVLEMLEPDIWLAQHNEYYDLAGKRKRAETEGVQAWIDPEGYRRFVAGRKRAFEDQVDLERGVKKPEERKKPEAAPAAGAGSAPVAVHDFARAETDRYFSDMVRKNGLGRLGHARQVTSIDQQDVVRMNRDTLYSSGVFDLDAGPVTITLPDTAGRFMSLQAIDEDHYTHDVAYAPVRRTFTREALGTRYAFFLVRTQVDASDPGDAKKANALQDAIRVEQASTGTFEVPAWDSVALTRAREALSALGALGSGLERFGKKGEVDPIDHLIGTATGWGGNPRTAADYLSVHPAQNDGKKAYTLTLRDVPVDGFWSITVYDAQGFMAKNDRDLYSLNDKSAKPNADGSFTIRFGGDPSTDPNCLPIVPGWNYTVRLYRPRPEVLDGTWKLPEARPVE